MPLDAQLAQSVAHLHDATFAQLLAGELKTPEQPQPASVDGVVCVERAIPGPHGDIPVRWYYPEGAEPHRLPALVWSHGGGWVGGDLDMPEADGVARRVAAGLPGVVVSVEYRLAPAHHHPVAMDEVAAAFEAVVADPDSFGVDPDRTAIGGASAGGHLTAAAVLTLRGPAPKAVFLVYPATDPIDGPYPVGRPEDCPTIMWLDGPIVAALFAGYLDADPSTASAPVVPAKGDLRGLPPHLVTTAGYDALKDQAVRYVELLTEAGVEATHHDEPTLLHGYANMVGILPAADVALTRHIDWLRAALR